MHPSTTGLEKLRPILTQAGHSFMIARADSVAIVHVVCCLSILSSRETVSPYLYVFMLLLCGVTFRGEG